MNVIYRCAIKCSDKEIIQIICTEKIEQLVVENYDVKNKCISNMCILIIGNMVALGNENTSKRFI